MNKCEFQSCLNSRTHSNGLCAAHAAQLRRGLALRPLRVYTRRVPRGTPCSAPGCDLETKAKSLCSAHYAQTRDGSNPRPLSPKRTPGEWRDWSINEGGYVVRYRNVDGVAQKQYQHREVMMEKLGRPLMPRENVHHMNGDKEDNRPENLELWTRSQPPGQRVEDKVEWAKSFLESYGFEIKAPQKLADVG